MIEEFHRKSWVDDGLVGIRGRTVYLVQAETRKQRRFFRDLMIDPHGKLIGVRHDLRGSSVRARAIGPLRIVRQRITGQQRRDCRCDLKGQGVAWKRWGVDSLALRPSGKRQLLRRAED